MKGADVAAVVMLTALVGAIVVLIFEIRRLRADIEPLTQSSIVRGLSAL